MKILRHYESGGKIIPVYSLPQKIYKGFVLKFEKYSRFVEVKIYKGRKQWNAFSIYGQDKKDAYERAKAAIDGTLHEDKEEEVA